MSAATKAARPTSAAGDVYASVMGECHPASHATAWRHIEVGCIGPRRTHERKTEGGDAAAREWFPQKSAPTQIARERLAARLNDFTMARLRDRSHKRSLDNHWEQHQFRGFFCAAAIGTCGTWLRHQHFCSKVQQPHQQVRGAASLRCRKDRCHHGANSSPNASIVDTTTYAITGRLWA
jgi:hypothetical protein